MSPRLGARGRRQDRASAPRRCWRCPAARRRQRRPNREPGPGVAVRARRARAAPRRRFEGRRGAARAAARACCVAGRTTRRNAIQGLRERAGRSGLRRMLFVSRAITSARFTWRTRRCRSSIAFFDADGVAVDRLRHGAVSAARATCPTYARPAPYRYAVEVPRRAAVGALGSAPARPVGVGERLHRRS